MQDRTTLFEAADVKVVTDNEGNKKEVIIPYDKFRKLMQIIEDHIFLHSPEIQEQIRQSEEDIKAGRYVQFRASEIDKLFEWLDEGGEEEVNGDERDT